MENLKNQLNNKYDNMGVYALIHKVRDTNTVSLENLVSYVVSNKYEDETIEETIINAQNAVLKSYDDCFNFLKENQFYDFTDAIANGSETIFDIAYFYSYQILKEIF